jgi:hypothetical protein
MKPHAASRIHRAAKTPPAMRETVESIVDRYSAAYLATCALRLDVEWLGPSWWYSIARDEVIDIPPVGADWRRLFDLTLRGTVRPVHSIMGMVREELRLARDR